MIISLNSGVATIVYSGDAATYNYPFTFPLLASSNVEVIVELNGEDVTADFPFVVNRTDFYVMFSSALPTIAHKVIIKRKTNVTNRLVDFTNSSTLREKDLDLDSKQAFYAVQELSDIESSLQEIDISALENAAQFIDDVSELQTKVTALETLTEDYSLLEAEVDGVGTAVTNLTTTVNSNQTGQNAANTTHTTNIANHETRLGVAETEINTLQADMVDVIADTVANTLAQNSLVTRTNDLDLFRIAAIAEIDSLQVSDAANTIKDANQDAAITNLNSLVDALEYNDELLDSRIDVNSTAITALDIRLDTAETEIDALQASDAAALITITDAFAADEARLNNHDTDIATLTTEQTALDTRMLAVEDDIGTINSQIDYLQAADVTLQASDVILTAGIDDLQGIASALDIRTGVLETWKAATITLLATLKTIATTAFTTLTGKTTPIGTDVIAIQEVDGTYKKVSITDLQATIGGGDTSAIEANIVALEAADVVLDGRVDILETANTDHETRIDALEAGGGGGGISALTGDVTASGAGSVVATIAINAVTTAKIADDAVTYDKIADDSIDSQHIIIDAVTTAKIAEGNVTRSRIADAAINAAKLADYEITKQKLATIPANTILGNNTGSTFAVDELTATEVTAMLDTAVGDSGSGGTRGLVPAPTTGDSTKFLRGDMTYQTISGGGAVASTENMSVASVTTNFSASYQGIKIVDGNIVTVEGQFSIRRDTGSDTYFVATLTLPHTAAASSPFITGCLKWQHVGITTTAAAYEGFSSGGIANNGTVVSISANVNWSVTNTVYRTFYFKAVYTKA